MSEVLGVNERWYPVGGSNGMERRPVTAVLVAGSIGDYAVYVGIGGREHAQDIARFGDKLSFQEAQRQFPGIAEDHYRV